MSQLILIRHGQSLWNLKNLFTGWVDIPLSRQGIEEATAAGKKLSKYNFDSIYTSTLMRAQQTAMMVMAYNDTEKVPIVQKDYLQNSSLAEDKKQFEWAKIYNETALNNSIPVHIAWQLNERFYGELQGLDKDETVQKFGADQVKIWRRSYDVPPPNGESLKLTSERTIPYFESVIESQVKTGKTILVSAHGNSLRSIVMHLEQLSSEEVLQLEIKTGDPIAYKFIDNKLTKIDF